MFEFFKRHSEENETENNIVVGNLYILDRDGIMGLKEFDPVKVRVLEKSKTPNTYTCVCVEPMVLPTMSNSYPIRLIDVPAKFLIPTTADEKVVIRIPNDIPIIKDTDIASLTIAMDTLMANGVNNPALFNSLESLLQKLCFYSSINRTE